MMNKKLARSNLGIGMMTMGDPSSCPKIPPELIARLLRAKAQNSKGSTVDPPPEGSRAKKWLYGAAWLMLPIAPVGCYSLYKKFF